MPVWSDGFTRRAGLIDFTTKFEVYLAKRRTGKLAQLPRCAN